MDQDDDLPAEAAAVVVPGPSAGPGSVGLPSPAAAPAAPHRPVMGIPPDLDHGGDHERCTMFEPALYIQRYTTVCRLLADVQRFGVVRKVLDMGCSEMSFLQFLKSIPTLSDICLLDISEETLRRHLHRASPGARDRLERRLQPLRVRVFCGDVTRPDTRLLGCDAVTGIEVIEHLESPVLRALPAALFGFLRPRLVVLTTPNAEFNELFPGFTGMRHWDHKFEWTRAEFQLWCAGVVSQYPEYEVSFDGIGPPPAGSERLGCCSQMAVFHRRDEPAAPAAAAGTGEQQPHQLLSDHQFPFESREDRLYNDVLYHARQIGYGRVEAAAGPRREELVPLAMIADMPSVSAAGASLDELVGLLSARGEPVVVHGGRPHVVYRPPADGSDSEDELAGGDLRPAEPAVGRQPAAGADSAAGDASYHDDWDNEPNWEQEIMDSRSWDSHAGCDWDGRPDPVQGWSEPSETDAVDHPPAAGAPQTPGSVRRLHAALPAYRLMLDLLRACFPGCWGASLAAALLPSIVAELNYR
ncbi:small RNA 2'-O-methyltransferase-like [Amphibalanus amphitrite]|uniref:small RNA 2'-O-methyltransferase-like n=1 Tax=Amphibalanus amphitrite TaxID=1232801 RepID=UPI001C925882|nr:small RNA 2'-O-methyltransferase-like [Amphibalanus amphitrite]